MLHVLRKRGVTATVYMVLIAAIAVVFAIQLRPALTKSKNPFLQGCAARVKGRCIELKSQRAAYLLLVPRDDQGQPLKKQADKMGLNRIVLEGLIKRELLMKRANELGFRVTEEEVTDSLYNGFIQVSLPHHQTDFPYFSHIPEGKIYVGFRNPATQKFDLKIYERTLRWMLGYSPEEFREEQKKELLAAKLLEFVQLSVRLSDQEIWQSYAFEHDQVILTSIAVLPSFAARYGLSKGADRWSEWAKEKTHAERIADLVKTRQEEESPKAGHIRHILVNCPPHGSEEQKQAALFKLASAADRIRRGEPFAQVARDVSEDIGSASRGGDVGDRLENFVPPFRKAAEQLSPGQVTKNAIQTLFGYHLIFKDDPQAPSPSEEALRNAIARELYQKEKGGEEAHTLASMILHQIRDKQKEGEAAITDALRTLSKRSDPIPHLSVQPYTEEITSSEEQKAASTQARGKKDAFLFSPPPRTVLNDPERPKLTPLAPFQNQERALSALLRIDPQTEKKLREFAFKAQKGALFPEPVQVDDHWVLLQLKEHISATQQDYDKERDSYTQKLLAIKQQEAVALYTQQLWNEAKGEIKIYSSNHHADTESTEKSSVSEEAEEDETG
ncbi:peptidylprolyl isomerase [Pajaroellobacter abortibovis]|uniref:PpiC domain-containing protein n=1 Tax=Pajaroellobacter abortibovis TaxID=1882918 RepID=A0A1L6MV82_9BACT|nr:peptidylprolyl isomerase [Pajaroellobacter abortibovis]APR99423.1 hypothetical protein BCY86_01045 [Pajaroellobacter abortibovis]